LKTVDAIYLVILLALFLVTIGLVVLRRPGSGSIDRLEPRLADHHIEIALPAVYVDAPLITQVLTNLLENAAKHTPAGTHVTISAVDDTDSVRVTVDDTGPDLPEGDPERLFAKFQRGRDESNTGGAGLGLAICRAIVNAHGESISAMRRPGGGARFVFTLPTAGPAP
jgi:two-component system, OmpR family, sensor histidine kinase KdpD